MCAGEESWAGGGQGRKWRGFLQFRYAGDTLLYQALLVGGSACALEESSSHLFAGN